MPQSSNLMPLSARSLTVALAFAIVLTALPGAAESRVGSLNIDGFSLELSSALVLPAADELGTGIAAARLLVAARSAKSAEEGKNVAKGVGGSAMITGGTVLLAFGIPMLILGSVATAIAAWAGAGTDLLAAFVIVAGLGLAMVIVGIVLVVSGVAIVRSIRKQNEEEKANEPPADELAPQQLRLFTTRF